MPHEKVDVIIHDGRLVATPRPEDVRAAIRLEPGPICAFEVEALAQGAVRRGGDPEGTILGRDIERRREWWDSRRRGR